MIKLLDPPPPTPNNCLIQMHTYFLMLFQKIVVHTKLDIYIFTKKTYNYKKINCIKLQYFVVGALISVNKGNNNITEH